MRIHTCFSVAVAWARNIKLATVNVVDKYELKVAFKEEPATLDRKYGDAVIKAMHES